MANVTETQQWLLELINLVRLDPLRYTSLPNAKAVQPLAFSDILLATSEYHADWMFENVNFGVTGELGSSPGDRINYAGYWPGEAWKWGETIVTERRGLNSSFTDYSPSALQAWEELGRDRNLRSLLLDDNFSEIGLDFRLDLVVENGKTFNVSALTVDFAGTTSGRFVTGRVYETLVPDLRYQPKPGQSGVLITTADGETLTGSAGGYEIRVFADEQVVSIGSASVALTMPDHNVKIDLFEGNILQTSASLTLLSGITSAYAIGSGAIKIGAADSAGAVNLYGAYGENRLIGNNHANLLDGMWGNDTMIGGGGDDTYIVDAIGDRVIERINQGTDTIIVEKGFYVLAGGVHVEILRAHIESYGNMTGNEFSQEIYGNASNNRLDGGGGADHLYGDWGNDTYIVDDVGDRIYESQFNGINTVVASIDFSLVDQYLENLELSGVDSTRGTGNAFANVIRGNAGNNVLDGGGGGDSLHGGLGDDAFIVDHAKDRAYEINRQGTDTVLSSVSYSLGGQFVENLTLTGTSHIKATGNGLANLLTGNSGSNVINGGKGLDTLFGGRGSDRFLFDNVPDASNVDTILDFTKGQDNIHLERDIFNASWGDGMLKSGAFKNLAKGLVDANDRIIFDQASGDVFYDADGSGASASIRFAVVSNGAVLTADDFVLV